MNKLTNHLAAALGIIKSAGAKTQISTPSLHLNEGGSTTNGNVERKREQGEQHVFENGDFVLTTTYDGSGGSTKVHTENGVVIKEVTTTQDQFGNYTTVETTDESEKTTTDDGSGGYTTVYKKNGVVEWVTVVETNINSHDGVQATKYNHKDNTTTTWVGDESATEYVEVIENHNDNTRKEIVLTPEGMTTTAYNSEGDPVSVTPPSNVAYTGEDLELIEGTQYPIWEFKEALAADPPTAHQTQIIQEVVWQSPTNEIPTGDESDNIQDKIDKQNTASDNQLIELAQQTKIDKQNTASDNQLIELAQQQEEKESEKEGDESRVICTYFYQKGQLDRSDWVADLRFTQQHISPQALRGYHAWGIPAVQIMRSESRFGRLIEPVLNFIAVHRAAELAYKMGRSDKPDYIGKLIRWTMEPMCWIIGAFAGEQDWQRLYTTKNDKTASYFIES